MPGMEEHVGPETVTCWGCDGEGHVVIDRTEDGLVILDECPAGCCGTGQLDKDDQI